jgi:hypothetical protein
MSAIGTETTAGRVDAERGVVDPASTRTRRSSSGRWS